MSEDDRKRQEICRTILGETEENLSALLRLRAPTTLRTASFDNLVKDFWLLPSDLSERIRKAYSWIREENNLLSRSKDREIFRQNDLWMALRNELPELRDVLQKNVKSAAAVATLSQDMKLQPSVGSSEEQQTERALLLRKVFDGRTILAIGRELQEPYCVQFNESGWDKDSKYYDEKIAAINVSKAITNDEHLLAFSVKYKDKLSPYWNFYGKFYTYNAAKKELKLEGSWQLFEQKLENLLSKHGMATYAVLKAFIELRKDYGAWNACDYNQLAYRAKEWAGNRWKQALTALEIDSVIEKRGSGRRPGERSMPPELVPLVQQVLSRWKKRETPPSIRKKPTIELAKSTEAIWDIFISHASEDKDEIARPLADALRDRGLNVWFDDFTLTLGDSLSRSIDHGLANSRFGVVILSPAFFNKEWPRRELDGLTAKEISSGKVILPVWHKVDREFVLRYSPVLADKLAVSTTQGLKRVIDEILKAISKAKPSA